MKTKQRLPLIKQEGFTLIELLIYMGIFSILLLILTKIFTAIIDVHLESQATTSVSQDGNAILSRLTYDVRQAQKLETPLSTTLYLEKSDGTKQKGYRLNGSNLMLTDYTVSPAVTDQVNSTNTTVPSITFTILSNSAPGSKYSAQVIMTVQSAIMRRAGVLQQQTFQTTIATRQ